MFELGVRMRCKSAIRKFAKLTAIVGVLLVCLPAVSQTNLGRISGAVTDQTGAAIVGAKVTVTDVDRGVARSLVTDSAGEYAAPSLTPGGNYSVRAELASFKGAERLNIDVPVGGDVRVDLQLQVGDQTQEVTVSGGVPMVNTTNATVSATLESKEITLAPVLGGQWELLFEQRPGMQSRPGQGSQSQVSDGNRPEQGVWMFDGLYNGALNNGGLLIGGTMNMQDQGTILPLDAIQELNFIEQPKAEYGWRSGAVVDVGLKSGTNQMHGTAHAEGRSTSLVARNGFLPAGAVKPTNDVEQFGGAFGGPIKKDKLFYFLDFEGQRYNIGNVQNAVLPTVASLASTSAPNGSPSQSFPDAIAGINQVGGTVSALSAALAGCTAGLTSTTPGGVTCGVASQGGNGGLFGNSGSASAFVDTEYTNGGSDNGLGKVDYHPNEHNTFNGELYWGGTPYAVGGSGYRPFFLETGRSFTQVVRAVWTWAPNSTLVNDMRFGYDRNFTVNEPGDCSLPHPNYANGVFVSGVPQANNGLAALPASTCGFPTVSITGISILGAGASTTGTGVSALQTYPQFHDTLSWSHGDHQFMFGFEARFQTYQGYGSGFGNNRGVIAFGSTNAFAGKVGAPTATSLEDFMSGIASSSGNSLLTGQPPVDGRSNAYAGFAQDDWRVVRRLTLNLGLRYEFTQPWYDGNGNWANFNSATTTGLVQQTGSTKILKSDFDGFMPRVGLAYDLTGKGTTVIRASAGIMDMINLYNAFGGTGRLATNPTGATFYNANGTSLVGPGSITWGTISVTNTGASGINANWLPNTPIFGPELGNVNFKIQCGNGVGSNPSPCNAWATNPNFRIPYVTEWNLSFQHQFTSNLMLNVAYVGNHGTKLISILDINSPVPGSGYTSTTSTTSTAAQESRPYYSQYPWFGFVDYSGNAYSSSYDALQTTLTESGWHGLSGTLGYVYGHALDDLGSDISTRWAQNEPASQAARGEYGDADTDLRHHTTVTLNYDIPGKKSPAQLLEGWRLTSRYLDDSAFPIALLDNSSNVSGTADLGDRWTLYGSPSQFTMGGKVGPPCYGITGSTFGGTVNCTLVTGPTSGTSIAKTANMPAACITAAANEAVNTTNPVLAGTSGYDSLAKYGCYAKGSSAIVPPAPGTFGTMSRNDLRGKGFSEWDVSLTKTWHIKERYAASFVFSAYNVLNQLEFATPTSAPLGKDYSPAAPSTFGISPSTPDINSSSTVVGQGGPRKFQFGSRFNF